MGTYYEGSDPCVYDSDYSNLTPPPYYEGESLFIYWKSQDSVYIIRLISFLKLSNCLTINQKN